jgi:hypothetical protein
MKHKPDSWNSASSDSQRGVRRSLTRAGLQLGQIGQVVTGALGSLQGGADPRGTAQSRMRELLNKDRALLSNRACGGALLLDQDDQDDQPAPKVPVKGARSRSAAQNRMRELLNQDRALLALQPDAPDADWLEEPAREVAPAPAAAYAQVAASHAPAGVFHGSTATVARGTCTGVSLSVEPQSVASRAVPAPAVVVPTPSAAVPVLIAPAVESVVEQPAPTAFAAAPEQALPGTSSAQAPARATSPLPPAAAMPARAASAPEEEGGDPIRTRSMAKLLAMQGYRDRALSIYEELIAAEPDNAELRVEADRLRA